MYYYINTTFSCWKNVSLIRCAHSWNIFQHSKRNFVSLRCHVISSICLVLVLFPFGHISLFDNNITSNFLFFFPGSPSGHSMITSAVLCLLVSWLLNSLRENLLCNMSILGRLIVNLSLWAVLMIILIFVSVSRVFIATHFPHQVIMGTVIGLILALVVKNYKTVLINISGSVRYCALCSLTLVTTTLASYLFLSFLVYDPSISVTKAQKWCIKPSYIHLDTTPFYAMVRDSGATLGLGISVGIVSSALRGGNWRGLRVGVGQLSLLSASLKVMLSILLLQLLEVISLPKSSALLFYVAGYVRCAFIPIIVILIVPIIAVWQWSNVMIIYIFEIMER